ncbi:uncharacterized protein LOC128735757 [Sabethes cyaneus]|uniref:uncharacterized protein LOC128735757 n=1 Tax=Sabethes cyaneus TaxID=53552 RepID=UPI00237D3813|nr:uncharacterized protein LOC128735757 [Sabethes cyaneus]
MSDETRDAPSAPRAATEREFLDLTTTPCGVCGPSTRDEQMISCDGCAEWFHSRCVGVAEDSVPEKWYCQNRACQQEYQKQQKDAKRQARGKKAADESDKPSDTLREGTSATEQRMKELEEQRKRQEEELEAEMQLKKMERRMQRDIERKRLEMEIRLREEEEEEKRALREEILQKKKLQIERMKASQRSFEQQVADLDRELEDLSVIKNPKAAAKQPQRVVSIGSKNEALKQDQANANKLASERDAEEELDHDEFDEDSKCTQHTNPFSGGDSPQNCTKVGDVSQNRLSQEQVGPTRTQLVARKGLPTKLPKFSGQPRQWPLFYATYKASNDACGYMNHENLVRLQECLEGRALELVAGQLLLPESVPRVIEKLRRHYGRPEQLLQEFLDQVNELEPPKPDNLKSFIPFGNMVEQLCEHLEAAGLRQHLVNPLLIKSLVTKIPDREKREWVHYQRRNAGGEPTLRTLTDFLMEIVDDACDADVDVQDMRSYQCKGAPQSRMKKSKGKGVLLSHSEASSSGAIPTAQRELKPCKVCQSTGHRLRHCDRFGRMPYSERLRIVTREKLCNVCLNEHGGQCKFRIRCNIGDCRARHNPLMHPVGSAVGMSAHIRSDSTVIFRIVPVKLYCGEKTVTVLAFLDEGASVTLVEKKLADRLGVVGVQERLTIKWTADVKREEKDSRRMNLWASGVGESANKLLLHGVRTVSKLVLPRQKLNSKELAAQYDHMRGLPIESYDGQPELLIGLNNIHSFAPLEAKAGTPVEPIAVRCKLGWTVYGSRHSATGAAGGYLGFHQGISNEDLHELLKSHYALEESVIVVPQETAEERRAREILEQTTKRVGDRFETGLLWKTDDHWFPDSFPMAQRRMKQLEKRLEKNPELHENVCRQIDEYQLKGYAHVATAEELNGTEAGKSWYLPLNVVQNPKKPGKVRLVWDAAATVQGVSLNSQLLKGPDMLVPLVKVMVGFRERRIAFGGDLKEMFHQLKIRTEDRQAQRFVFRKHANMKPSVYVMDVATFGSTSSPCSAQFVKNKNAEDFAAQYPRAATAIINRHYVDDYFDSVDHAAEAVQLAKEVRFVHSKAGFEIRNWVSNSLDVLKGVGEEKPLSPVHFNQDKHTSEERVLGVIWDPMLDEFAFSTKHRVEVLPYLFEEKRPTKRLVASCVMGFFDPLGLLSPFTIHGKIIIQHLWRSKCDWDQEIDVRCWNLWKRWTGLLPAVEAIRIPRCYLGKALTAEVDSLEVHIFTDASEHVYGCVAYLRAVVKGTVQCSLIMSRVKVAPLKRQSIPRLELMAALLGARMCQNVLSLHSYKILRTVFWTDSRTVCSWLHSDQHKFKQFVAFRVGEIWELTQTKDWRWIPTKLNIADVLTKWGDGPPLQSDGEWFKGPEFLYRPQSEWPTDEIVFDETDEEARGVVLFHEVIDATVISRWTKLLRVKAYVVRFVANCRRKVKGEPMVTTPATVKQKRLTNRMINYVTVQVPLTKEELQQAETIMWRQVQWDSFPDEMSALTKNLNRQTGEPLELIKKFSPIYKSSPVLDDEGVLRMEGRLAEAVPESFDRKYPIILSRTHGITKKLIQHYHEEFGHGNSETVFNEMRQRFHIPKLHSAVQQVVRNCVWCKVNKCSPSFPRMAPLPVERVTAHKRPFDSVGIDYLGPLEITIGRRREKRWVAVFTCLTIRAVHLEVVHSLSTVSCRMAISRFQSKFGKPTHIFSDNATCFRGANNEIVKMKRINQECAEELTSPVTAWHFNPPGTPHMGGIWERMVRSVKEAMRALMDGRKLTEEVLVTVLAKAADMINRRPLTYLPQTAEETAALTPNHFLRGTVTSADVEEDSQVTSSGDALRNGYQRSQYLADKMWERWSREYLPTINQRTKWFDEQKPLEKGDLVFVIDGKNRKCWKRGIIEATVKGADGRVRQADVRTSDGSVQRRGAVNLAILEIQ